MILNFRPVMGIITVSAFSFMAGATLFGHAQTADEQQALERAQSALRRDGYGPRVRNDTFVSGDGNNVIFDLGEVDHYGAKARSQAVYDFTAKKSLSCALIHRAMTSRWNRKRCGRQRKNAPPGVNCEP